VKAIILCAGYGTRLGGLTESTPKAMLRIQNVPVLEFILRHVAAHGYREIGVNLHFRPDQIREYFGDGADFGVRIHYREEQQLTGTAGALPGFLHWIGDTREVLVVYGDVVTDQDLGTLRERHAELRADATLLLHRRPGSNSRVTLDAAGRIVGFRERPPDDGVCGGDHDWVNSAIQLVSTRLIEELRGRGFADLPADVYEPMVSTKTFVGVPLQGFRVAIDSPERFASVHRALVEGRFKPLGFGDREWTITA
jgi:mannose-1-phosphate guanylyltransferase/phosphomannomutase